MLWGKRKCKLWKFRLANICVLQGHPTQRFFNFTFFFSFFSFFTFVLPETWKHYHIAIPSLKTDPKIPYNTMWYQKPSESKSSMTTLRIRKCGGSQTSQDLLRLNSMCFQCVVDLLWKCFQCVGFGFKLSNAQIFCRKTNVVEKQENWLETLSFMLFFTEYLQKGNWVQKNLNAGFSVLCYDCYDISSLCILQNFYNIWRYQGLTWIIHGTFCPQKNVTSRRGVFCGGVFQKPAKTHENCDFQECVYEMTDLST